MDLQTYTLLGTGVLGTFIAAKKLFRPRVISVEPNTALIVERFNRYYKTYEPGYHVKWTWFPQFYKEAARIVTAIAQHNFTVEGRTPENAYIKLAMELHYHISEPYKYYYQLTRHREQIESFAKDVVIGKITTTGLIEAHIDRRGFLQTLKQDLQDRLDKYGIALDEAVAEIPDPGPEVKAAFGRMVEALTKTKGLALSMRELASIGFNPSQSAAILIAMQANDAFVQAAQGGGNIFTGPVGPEKLTGFFSGTNKKTPFESDSREGLREEDIISAFINPARQPPLRPQPQQKTASVPHEEHGNT